MSPMNAGIKIAGGVVTKLIRKRTLIGRTKKDVEGVCGRGRSNVLATKPKNTQQLFSVQLKLFSLG